MLMKKTLLILAGGMGSRYGGLKQIDWFGPHNESILEYSIYDAHRAGFTDVVIVLRRDFLEKFEDKFVNTFQNTLPVTYVFQEFDVTRFWGNDGSHREKPWGTAHAILSAKEVISGPFAVINADDYYGQSSFGAMAAALDEVSPTQSCMIGYILENTLSPYGSVNRGVCHLSDDGLLQGVEEHHSIAKDSQGSIGCKEWVVLAPDTIVSMNFWWFDASFMNIIERDFSAFLQDKGSDVKAECYIPFVVDDAIHHDGHNCKVVRCNAQRMGVTNPEDKQEVQEQLQSLYVQEVYPEHLWK
jgi:NDP-sugar pyrophosphorylase family protein